MGIIADILENAREETTKTKLMYACNLSFDHFQSYLDFVLKRGLLEMMDKRGQTMIRTTGKGIEFLRLYRTIESIINT
mgnify:CR=1 FL=1